MGKYRTSRALSYEVPVFQVRYCPTGSRLEILTNAEQILSIGPPLANNTGSLSIPKASSVALPLRSALLLPALSGSASAATGDVVLFTRPLYA